VAIGIPGEIYIGGLGVARGYANAPDLTAEKFIPDRFSATAGQRLYRTGDLARYLADGNIEFLGRLDHQVKVRGFRIELGEIESLLSTHPRVKEAVVIVREDTPGDKRLVAYIVADYLGADYLWADYIAEGDVRRPSASLLRQFLTRCLPEYMLPSAYVFVERLPVTTNGKVDRNRLPAPDRCRPMLEKALISPRDPVELELRAIWERVLDVRPIGVRDDFFELGGHSLLVVRLISEVEKKYSKQVKMAEFLQRASIEHLGEMLKGETGREQNRALVAIEERGNKEPFFCVHPGSGNVLCYVGLARQMGEEQPFYGLRDVTLDEEEQSYRSIEQMAGEYIEAIKEVQARGPYYVGGYSFGAMVAYEMAQQLRETGEGVGMVVLLDGVSPSESRERFRGADEAMLLAIIATEMRSEGGKTIKEMSEELRGKGKREQMREVMKYVMRGEEEEEGRGEEVWAGAEGYIERQLEVFKARIEAVERYEEKRYEGAVTLIMSGGGGGEGEGAMGWEKVMGRGLEVRRMRGGHATMLKEPEVEELGQQLKICLDKARSCAAVG